MIKTLNIILVQEGDKPGDATLSINGFRSLGEAIDVAMQVCVQAEVKKALEVDAESRHDSITSEKGDAK